jgi:hypothetical protein
MNFTRILTVLSWVRLKSHTIRGFMYCPNVSTAVLPQTPARGSLPVANTTNIHTWDDSR